ncbi:MAG: glycosyltransferase family 4 protein [Thermodesulfobacteriota bacterium]
MRIGINALYLLPGKVGGSEIYIRNLVRWLPRVGRDDTFVIFVNRESAGVFEAISPGVEVVNCAVNAASRPARILYEQFVLPFRARRSGVDILLSAGMTAPFFSPARSYVMVYDLQHVNQPQNFGRLQLLFLKAIIYMSARSSHGVLTLSEKSKSDIVRHYNIAPGRVHVTHLASDESSFHRQDARDVAEIRKKHDLPKRFILYIASSLPHKNYERLLAAFKVVKAKDRPVKLVLIGARSYGHDAISKKIAELGLEKEVVFLGWLPFEDIPLIYAASELFVFPSLHEGFGIPVLEAMATGVPVVCSRIEPLGEVAGDAALYVDPLNAGAMAEGMLKVLKDKSLREGLIEKGLARAALFSWEKTAKATLRALKDKE